MPVSATPATRTPSATQTPSTAEPSAPAPLASRAGHATRTWTSAPSVRGAAGMAWGPPVSRTHTGCASSPGANPCEHLGRCMNTQGSFLCQCGRGYTGPRCETDINECLSGPCQNQATCLDRIGQFTCICLAGVCGLGRLDVARDAELGGRGQRTCRCEWVGRCCGAWSEPAGLRGRGLRGPEGPGLGEAAVDGGTQGHQNGHRVRSSLDALQGHPRIQTFGWAGIPLHLGLRAGYVEDDCEARSG